MTVSDHPNLLAIGLQAVVEASAEIMKIYSGSFASQYKEDGSPVTDADFASNQVLIKRLSETGIPIISEEAASEDYELRKTWTRCWSVDPLDGTKEFLKRNDEFAICVALIENGIPTLGIIASPVKEEILTGGTDIPVAAFAFSQIDQPQAWHFVEPGTAVNKPLVLAGSRTHHSGNMPEYTDGLRAKFGDIDLMAKGSALKFFDLALGRADVYPRFAPTMEWDIAAGQAILTALGGCVVNAETNEPLRYNKKSLYNPHFIAKTNAFMHAETA